ncbi:unnamed protein product [Diamesa serratosioi]
MDDESAEESGAAPESAFEEELIPKVVTDEIFDEVTSRGNIIIRDLTLAKQFTVSEDIQKLVCVCQNIRQNLLDEKDLVEQMRTEVNAASGRVGHAVKMSKADQEVIQQLKSEIDEAYSKTDAAQSREQIAQEAMNVLREKLEKLQKEAEKYTDRGDTSEEGGTATLSKQKEGVRERDRMINELEDLNKRLQTQTKYMEELEEKYANVEEKIKDLYSQNEEISNESFKGKRTLEHLQTKLEETTDEKNVLTEELKKFKQQAEAEHRVVVQQNMQMLGLRANLDKQTTQNNLNNMKLSRYSADLDNLMQLKDKLNNDLNTKNNILKLKEDENIKFRLENAKITKSREILMKKMVVMDGSKTNLENETLKLKNIISTFEKEREQTKKSSELAKKYSDGLLRERDLVRKELVKSNNNMSDQKRIFSVAEQQLKTLENEIKQHILVENKLNNILSKTTKSKEELSEELQNALDKVDEINEEAIAKTRQIIDFKEKFIENQSKFLKCQHDLQALQTDINNLEKDLQLAKDLETELKDRIKSTTVQLDKSKEIISSKDEDSKKTQKHVEKIEKEKQILKAEIQSSLIALQHTKSELLEIKTENIQLTKTLRESDAMTMKKSKQLDQLVSEKEVITTQTTRKNDEIGLLNQKINNMQLCLDRSNSQYNERLQDINVLKIEIKNIRSQRNLLTRGLANTADMRQEVLQLNRVYCQERVRTKALENEMSTPINIHRWRKLSGIDKDKKELLEKIQILQKRLLSQTSVLAKTEDSVQKATEKVQHLEDTKSTLKLPRQEAKEELMITRHKLSSNTKKIKAAMALSKVKDEDLKVKDFSINDLKNSLFEFKRKLLNEKKENSRLTEKLREFHKSDECGKQSTLNEYRILGSGFKIKS